MLFLFVDTLLLHDIHGDYSRCFFFSCSSSVGSSSMVSQSRAVKQYFSGGKFNPHFGITGGRLLEFLSSANSKSNSLGGVGLNW